MQSHIKTLVSLGFIDGSFVSLDSTSIETNTSELPAMLTMRKSMSSTWDAKIIS
ncbi:MAG TPA: hypothetical protein VIO64_19510 [Pseudobacteroides sp.]|uniref:hypothetical protein n=1 Tax=Pseudobacteroides sp. TaxID=1968840 RepID=UPI002F92AE12